MPDLRFSCRCGTVTGLVEGAGPRPEQGTHVQCFCADCRDSVLWLGQVLPEDAPVGYYQTVPDRVRFLTGAERLAVIAWRRANFLRWYADCCRTPLFNTPATPGVPFASLHVAALADARPLGPPVARAFVPAKGGKTRTEGAWPVVIGLLRRSLPARLSGRWKETPFFDAETRRPVARPRRLTAEDRAQPMT